MSRAEGPESGEQLFLEQLALIERVIAFVCSRNHLAASDADDFASHVKLTLIDDDYAVLRKFQGRSSLKTYLAIVIQRLFLDYRISAWGKWRPSAEAKRAGALALLLEQLMMRDSYSFDEACELLRSKHRVTADRAELEQIAAKLPGRLRRRFESEDTLVDVPTTTMSADEVIGAAERQARADRVSAVMKAQLARVDTQDRLLLALRFQDGRTVADIAKILRQDQKALYRRVDRLLDNLREGFEREGIDAAAVIEMLEGSAVHLEWNHDAPQEETAPHSRAMNGGLEWQ